MPFGGWISSRCSAVLRPRRLTPRSRKGASEHRCLMQKGIVINLLDKEIRDVGAQMNPQVQSRISRWCRVACDSENLVDASSPLLLQASMKLYGIDGHVVLLLTFVFERWTRSGSSPSASAQYISASFRYWRLSRSDFATTVR